MSSIMGCDNNVRNYVAAPYGWQHLEEREIARLASARWEISASPCPAGHAHRAVNVWTAHRLYVCADSSCKAIGRRNGHCDCGKPMLPSCVFSDEAHEECPLHLLLVHWIVANQQHKPLPEYEDYIIIGEQQCTTDSI